MYRCDDCGETFHTPEIIIEKYGEYHGVDAYGDRYVCPYCRSEEISEMRRCICGEYITQEEDFCPVCIDTAVECIDAVAKVLKITQREAEDLLQYVIEQE